MINNAWQIIGLILLAMHCGPSCITSSLIAVPQINGSSSSSTSQTGTSFVPLKQTSYVDPYEVVEYEPLQTFRYSFAYGHAQDFISDIKRLYPQSFFVIDKRTNAIIVQSVEKQWQAIKKTLSLLDKKTHQIKIKVKVLESSEEAFESINPSFSNVFSKKQVNLSTDIMDSWVNGTIDLLIKSGKAKLLAEPTILSVNNKKASVTFGDDIPYSTTTWLNNSIVKNLSYINTGITLEILPRITTRTDIQLDTTITVTHAKTWREDGDQQYPVVSNRKSTSSTYVKSGSHVIMAGMFEENSKENIQAIPLLSDIPFLGDIFKQRKDEKTTSEIMIILSPEIIKN